MRAAHRQELVDPLTREVVAQAEEDRVVGQGLRRAVEEVDLTHGAHKGDDLDTVRLLQPLLRHGARSHSCDGLARTAPTSAARRLDAVLLEVRPIRMAGPRVEVDGLVAVVLRSLVLVGHGQEDGGAEGDAVLGAGVDGDEILLIAGGGDGGLTGATTVELGLDVGLAEGEVRGTVFQDAGDGFAVGLAGAGCVLASCPQLVRRDDGWSSSRAKGISMLTPRARNPIRRRKEVDLRCDPEVVPELRHDCGCSAHRLVRLARREAEAAPMSRWKFFP